MHTALVSGLAANASYGVSIQAGGNGNLIGITAGGTGSSADSAGVLRLTF